jgi:hypothetical protein
MPRKTAHPSRWRGPGVQREDALISGYGLPRWALFSYSYGMRTCGAD